MDWRQIFKKYMQNHFKNKNTETGRSMIEMLGVLSISALLMVGGFLAFGYLMDIWRAYQIQENSSQTRVLLVTDQIKNIQSAEGFMERTSLERYSPEIEEIQERNVIIYKITLQVPSESLQKQIYLRKKNFAKMDIFVSVPDELAKVVEIDHSRESWIEAGMHGKSYDMIMRGGGSTTASPKTVLFFFEKKARTGISATNSDGNHFDGIMDVECQASEYWNEETGRCELCDFSKNYYWSTDLQKCVHCDEPKTRWDMVSEKCVCPAGQAGDNCETCIAPRTWDESKKACVCPAHLPATTENGSCEACESPRTWFSEQNACLCPETKPAWTGLTCKTCAAADPNKPIWNPIRKECVPCPDDKVWSKTLGKCVCGGLWVEDTTTGKCKCPHLPKGGNEQTCGCAADQDIVNDECVDMCPNNIEGMFGMRNAAGDCLCKGTGYKATATRLSNGSYKCECIGVRPATKDGYFEDGDGTCMRCVQTTKEWCYKNTSSTDDAGSFSKSTIMCSSVDETKWRCPKNKWSTVGPKNRSVRLRYNPSTHKFCKGFQVLKLNSKNEFECTFCDGVSSVQEALDEEYAVTKSKSQWQVGYCACSSGYEETSDHRCTKKCEAPNVLWSLPDDGNFGEKAGFHCFSCSMYSIYTKEDNKCHGGDKLNCATGITSGTGVGTFSWRDWYDRVKKEGHTECFENGNVQQTYDGPCSYEKGCVTWTADSLPACEYGQVVQNCECKTVIDNENICCAKGEFVNGAGKCESCPEGQVPNDDKTECRACEGADEYARLGECLKCEAGYYPEPIKRSRCLACQNGMVTNAAKTGCECPSDNPDKVYTYNGELNRCVDEREHVYCEEEGKPLWNEETKECEACPEETPFWHALRSECSRCDGGVWQASTDACVECLSANDCPSLKPMCTTDHKCEACPARRVWDKTNQKCVCDSMYEEDGNGSCICKTTDVIAENEISMPATVTKGACSVTVANLGKLKGTYYFKWKKGYFIIGKWSQGYIEDNHCQSYGVVAGENKVSTRLYVKDGSKTVGQVLKILDVCQKTVSQLQVLMPKAAPIYYTFDGTNDVTLEFRDDPCNDNDSSSKLTVELHKVSNMCQDACKAPREWKDDKCLCPSDKPYWSPSKELCVADCPAEEPFKNETVCEVCPVETPVWNGSACVACTSEDDTYCVGLGQACDTSTQTCKSCFDVYNTAKPYWNSETQVCEACPTATPIWSGTECISCPSATPVWNGSACVACTSEDDTYCVGLGQVCDTSSQT